MAFHMLQKVAWLLVLLTLSSWCPSADARVTKHNHKHSFGEAVTNTHRRQTNATAFIAVTGIRDSGSDVLIQPRLEIRELERRPDEFNLFLLALQRWMDVSQDNKESYFQIAGIHGRPYISWDGVEASQATALGYCRHSSNLFPTWHRPYLALVEAELYKNAREMVDNWSGGEFKLRMQTALEKLRLPYWDAAAVPPDREGSYPWCVQRRTIKVEIPDGNLTAKIMIPNPLYKYTFHPLPQDAFREKKIGGSVPERWLQWNATMRSPTTFNATAESRDELIALHLDANRDNQRQRTYQMLALHTEYYNISNNMARNGVADSLESAHDTLHNTIGDEGHMWNVQYSAFDPVFWLLHAMLAIWQSLNSDSYVTNHSNVLGTFTTPPKSWADENTQALHPFHRNLEGDFWTSETVRDHTIFAYTYPELLNLSDDDTLVSRVNRLYGPNATSQFSWDLRLAPAPDHSSCTPSPTALTGDELTSTMQDTSASSAAGQVAQDHQHGRNPHSMQGSDVHYQYFANIRTSKGGLEAAYKVYVFLDASPATSEVSTATWRQLSGPELVGFVGFQDMGGIEVMKATQEEDAKMMSVVALTEALEEKVRQGQLSSMDDATVGAYLQEKMTWQIVTADGQVIAAWNAPGFEIDVSWAKMTPPTPDSFPRLQGGGFRRLMHATSGKAGGCRMAKQFEHKSVVYEVMSQAVNVQHAVI